MARYVKDGIVYDDGDIQANAGSGGFFGTSNDVQSDISASIALEEIRAIEARIDSDVAKVDSDLVIIAADVAAADSDAQLAKEWAVGPNPPADRADPSDTNNSYYWSQQAEGHHGNSEIYARVAKSWADGDSDIGDPVEFGDATNNAQYWSNTAEQWAIDTDIDTFTEGSAKYWASQAQMHAQHFELTNQVNDFDTEAATLRMDTSSGLEFYQISDGLVGIREYVPPAEFDATISPLQADYSWFNISQTRTATYSSTNGTITSINTPFSNFASLTTPTVSGNTLTYTAPATPNDYNIVTTINGTGPAGAGTDHVADAWTVYRDYFVHTLTAEGDPGTAGRHQSNLATHTETLTGHAYITVADGVTFTLSDAFGDIPLPTPTSVDITLNGVTRTYDRYYIGEYDGNTITITV